MNIGLNQYYVTRDLSVVLAKGAFLDTQVNMVNPNYMKSKISFASDKKGNYHEDKLQSHRDVITKIECKSLHQRDLFILDLFQLADYTMNRSYTTVKNITEKIEFINIKDHEISICHTLTRETYNYTVVSIETAISVSNKISKLHRALEGY
jgi:hypothetical protein